MSASMSIAFCVSSLIVVLSSSSRPFEMCIWSSLDEAVASSSSSVVSAFRAPSPLTPLVFDALSFASSTSRSSRSCVNSRYAFSIAVGSSMLSMASDSLRASYNRLSRSLSLRKTCSRTVSSGEDDAVASLSLSSSSCTWPRSNTRIGAEMPGTSPSAMARRSAVLDVSMRIIRNYLCLPTRFTHTIAAYQDVMSAWLQL